MEGRPRSTACYPATGKNLYDILIHVEQEKLNAPKRSFLVKEPCLAHFPEGAAPYQRGGCFPCACAEETSEWCFLCLFSADPFEMMLKSFLRYQSSLNGDTGESHLRRKLYESGVSKSLQSNLALIQKVTCSSVEEKPYVAHGGKFNENDY